MIDEGELLDAFVAYRVGVRFDGVPVLSRDARTPVDDTVVWMADAPDREMTVPELEATTDVSWLMEPEPCEIDPPPPQPGSVEALNLVELGPGQQRPDQPAEWHAIFPGGVVVHVYYRDDDIEWTVTSMDPDDLDPADVGAGIRDMVDDVSHAADHGWPGMVAGWGVDMSPGWDPYWIAFRFIAMGATRVEGPNPPAEQFLASPVDPNLVY